MATPYAELLTAFRGSREQARSVLRSVDPAHRDLRMDLAWRAYNGELDPPLRRKPNQPDDNVFLNVCRGVVDKGVSFLFGRGLTWTLDDSQTRSDDEKYLDAVWEHNKGKILLHRFGTNGGVFGQAFLKIRVEEPYPRLIVLDSSKVTVETADDDHTFVRAFAVHWSGTWLGKPADFRQLIRRVGGEETIREDGVVARAADSWAIEDQVRQRPTVPTPVRDDGGWETYHVESWPKPYPPVVSCQNLPSANDYWGIEDLTPDVIRVQEAINRTLSNINRILRLHAHPKTWSKGLSASQQDQIKIDPDGMIHLPGVDASLQNLEMKSDLASSLVFYQKLREGGYEVSRVPQVASGTVEDLQYLSAMAMQTLYGPLIEKTETKKGTYGEAVVETNYTLLDLAGRSPKRCTLVWPELLPRDAQVEALTAEVEQRIGVSRDTLVAKLGYDPVYERERRKADQAEDVERAEDLAKADPSPTAASGATARRRPPVNVP